MKRALPSVARLITLTLALQGFGCASIAHGYADKIHVQSRDPDARLYVNGQFIGMGSGTTTVKRDQTSTISAEKAGCATAIQDTGSKFNPASVRDYTDGAPLLGILGDTVGVTQDVGKTVPQTYTVTPVCPPAASPALS